MLASLKARARRLETETYALYLAYRDPAVPWHAKAFAALVVVYAASPLDLIPDFIPLLGYLDDLIIIPLGIAIALRMIPPDAMARARAQAAASAGVGIHTRAGVAVVFSLWLIAAILIGVIVVRAIHR